MMTLDEFKNLLDTYSADLSRWPQDKLQPAVALTKSHATAQQLLEAAMAVDDTLRHYVPPAANIAALENRILAAIEDIPAGQNSAAPHLASQPWTVFGWRPAFIFAPSGGLMAAALIGFMIGAAPVQHTGNLLDPAYYSVEQILNSDTEMYEGGLF